MPAGPRMPAATTDAGRARSPCQAGADGKVASCGAGGPAAPAAPAPTGKALSLAMDATSGRRMASQWVSVCIAIAAVAATPPAPLVWLVAISAALVAAGLAGFGRRDLGRS